MALVISESTFGPNQIPQLITEPWQVCEFVEPNYEPEPPGKKATVQPKPAFDVDEEFRITPLQMLLGAGLGALTMLASHITPWMFAAP